MLNNRLLEAFTLKNRANNQPTHCRMVLADGDKRHHRVAVIDQRTF